MKITTFGHDVSGDAMVNLFTASVGDDSSSMGGNSTPETEFKLRQILNICLCCHFVFCKTHGKPGIF